MGYTVKCVGYKFDVWRVSICLRSSQPSYLFFDLSGLLPYEGQSVWFEVGAATPSSSSSSSSSTSTTSLTLSAFIFNLLLSAISR